MAALNFSSQIFFPEGNFQSILSTKSIPVTSTVAKNINFIILIIAIFMVTYYKDGLQFAIFTICGPRVTSK